MAGAARIEVCGGLASGKTSFARLFRGSPVTPVFETFRANPFWRKFLSAPLQYSFETEVAFMLHHSHQIKEASARASVTICDFSLFLDLAYARVGAHESRFKILRTVWAEVVRSLNPPTLVVYLQCDARTQLKRIRARGRAGESSITLGYLRRLNDAVSHEVARTEQKVRVMRIDSRRCNFVSNRQTKRLLRGCVLELAALL